MTPGFAPTHQPPYYAAIFTSQRTAGDQGYGAMADRMLELASQQPGYLGAESVRDAQGFGITVSYWSSEAAIRDWKQHAEHQVARHRATPAGTSTLNCASPRSNGPMACIPEPPCF